MSTALVLVNRWRRLHRESDVTAFATTDELTTVGLDLVNEAKRDILESRLWPFDIRHDGILQTRASQNGTQASVTNGVATFLLTGFASTADLVGSFVSRIAITEDANYGNTAFRVVDAQVVASNTSGTFEQTWPGTSFVVNADWRSFVYEYEAPSTVRALVSARHQEQPIAVHQIGPEIRFDELYPRPTDTRDDSPQWIAFGGELTQTITTGGTAATPAMRILVYPTPDAGTTIHYSYAYRHPDLAAATDNLTGVDIAVEDLIVRLAYARSMFTAVGNEPALGAVLEREVFLRVEALHRGLRRDPYRRNILRSLDAVTPRLTGFGRLPRNVGSL